jgi:hypothetical protein
MKFDLSCVMGYLWQGGCCLMFPKSTLVARNAYWFGSMPGYYSRPSLSGTANSRDRVQEAIIAKKRARLNKYHSRDFEIRRAHLGHLPPDMSGFRSPNDRECLRIGSNPVVLDDLAETPNSLPYMLKSKWLLEAWGWKNVRPSNAVVGRPSRKRKADECYDPEMSDEKFFKF